MSVAVEAPAVPLVFENMDVFWKSSPEEKMAAWNLVNCELCGRKATMFYPVYLKGARSGPFEVTRARCDFHHREV